MFYSVCVNCKDCSPKEGCRECDTGFILNVDGTCQPCPNVDADGNCAQCGSSTRGRFLESGTCSCKIQIEFDSHTFATGYILLCDCVFVTTSLYA